ncbi:MAG TPA: hypothetical protein VEC09_09110 [Actinomycetota bacterium]|nr:hypothetical protein [Actinomycetota bacterium]
MTRPAHSCAHAYVPATGSLVIGDSDVEVIPTPITDVTYVDDVGITRT